MSDPLDGPITAKQMAALLDELKEDFGAQLDRRLATHTLELDDIIVAAVKGGVDNVKNHLDRRIGDLAERVERLESNGTGTRHKP